MGVDSPVHGAQGLVRDEGPAREEQQPAGARPRVSIVLPVLNEARNLLEVLPALPEVDQVVVVDGGSVDGSAEVARSLLPHVDVVQQTRRGVGNALVCGFAAATGDIVVTFPADGSADPAEIPPLVQALLAGADVARGSRFLPGGSDGLTPLRRIGVRALGGRAKALLETSCTDLGHGVSAFWSDVLDELDLPSPAPDDAGGTPHGRRLAHGDGAEIEALLQCRAAVAGLAITEVPSRQRRIRGAGTRHAARDGLRVLRAIHLERQRARQGARRVVRGSGTTLARSAPQGVRTRETAMTGPSPDRTA